MDFMASPRALEQGHAIYSEQLCATQELAPGQVLGPGRDVAPDHESLSDHVVRTSHYEITSVRPTKPYSWISPTAIHCKMETLRLGPSPSRTRRRNKLHSRWPRPCHSHCYTRASLFGPTHD